MCMVARACAFCGARTATVKERKSFLLSSGECRLSVTIPSAARKGERIPIVIVVDNQSTKLVQSVTVKLVETVFWRLVSLSGFKCRRFARVVVNDGRTEKRSTKAFTFEYQIPESVRDEPPATLACFALCVSTGLFFAILIVHSF